MSVSFTSLTRLSPAEVLYSRAFHRIGCSM